MIRFSSLSPKFENCPIMIFSENGWDALDILFNSLKLNPLEHSFDILFKVVWFLYVWHGLLDSSTCRFNLLIPIDGKDYHFSDKKLQEFIFLFLRAHVCLWLSLEKVVWVCCWRKWLAFRWSAYGKGAVNELIGVHPFPFPQSPPLGRCNFFFPWLITLRGCLNW